LLKVFLSSYYSSKQSIIHTLKISTALVDIELFTCALSFSVLLHLDQICNQQNAHLKLIFKNAVKSLHFMREYLYHT